MNTRHLHTPISTLHGLALAFLALGGATIVGCDPGGSSSAQPAGATTQTTTTNATAPGTPVAAEAANRPPTPAPPAPDTELLAVGRDVVSRSFSVLSSNLLGALGRSSPAEALEFCSVNVGPILESLPVPPGTRVRRVSHKPRNPANRASTAELALIDSHAAALAAGHTNPPSLSVGDNGSVTVYAPIVLGHPACLLCHGQPGTDIAPATAQAIARLYPADEAHGFRQGEIRGLWAVTFPVR